MVRGTPVAITAIVPLPAYGPGDRIHRGNIVKSVGFAIAVVSVLAVPASSTLAGSLDLTQRSTQMSEPLSILLSGLGMFLLAGGARRMLSSSKTVTASVVDATPQSPIGAQASDVSTVASN
jgi:hypothetical protein